jgi:signal transduction histidine kinase/CheY-like chemotaxis protein
MRPLLSAISILIVDDEREYAELLAERLESEGWDIRTASSAQEAQHILQHEPIDILASDFRLEDKMTGAELVNRALAFKPNLYSIIFTAHDDRAYVLKSLDVGVAAFLQKIPSLDDDLKAAITLTRIGEQLLELDTEDEILELIVQSLAQLKEFDGCCLVVRGDQEICRVERAVDFRSGEELTHQPIEDSESAYRYVIDAGRAYLPPLFTPAGKVLRSFTAGSCSIAVVPLVLKGGVKGALGIEHRDENRLGVEDLRFLSQIAHWVSLAMSKLTQQDRVHLEEELSRERRDLLARAALHEIKNPLNNLAIAVQVAADGVAPETRHALLDNVGRINAALNRILRPLIRGEDAPPEPVEVNRVIQEAVSRFRLYHPDAATRLVENISPALPTIIGHRAMLVSALVNLFENGVTATESVSRKPEIRVTAGYVPARDQVEVVVNDNGCGIPAHLLDRVFDYGMTSQPERGHSGYGLAFTKDVVNLSGGYISVQSKEGDGTTFKLSFPVGAYRAAQEDRPREARESRGLY